MLDNKRNLLFLLIFFLTSGFLGLNLWLSFTKPAPLSPVPGQLISQNLAEIDFGQVLAEATKTAVPQTQVTQVLISGKVTIALLGDSMVETLGDLANLALALKQYYPNVEFDLLNFGVGATKPANGLQRLTQETKTATKNLPPLLLAKPDIVVVESFAYNHGKNTQEDIVNHYKTISEIIQKLKQSGVIPLFLVTIAPTQAFAKNAPGILWDENQRILEAQTVIDYLKAGIRFAQEQKWQLVDVFNPSLGSDSFGKQIYVNSHDFIHPSQEGIELVSDLAAQKITKEKMVEKILGF